MLFRYQAKLEALYTALEERQKERLRSLKEGTGGTVAERVKQVGRSDCPRRGRAERYCPSSSAVHTRPRRCVRKG